ncbi:MAG: GIY-YIG nuclease family protein [Verrucomicrobia subdivision 3 bacterium]|nr:GIY-YIG nuclease family protein [Limisphaerales bacterium]
MKRFCLLFFILLTWIFTIPAAAQLSQEGDSGSQEYRDTVNELIFEAYASPNDAYEVRLMLAELLGYEGKGQLGLALVAWVPGGDAGKGVDAAKGILKATGPLAVLTKADLDTLKRADDLFKKKTEGIYEFTGTSGKKYVGQSGNIPKRLKQHESSGKLSPNSRVEIMELSGGKTASEIQEQLRINELGGIKNLEYKRNPIGKNRKHILPEVEP